MFFERTKRQLKTLKNVNLTSDERSAMRARLVEFVKTHPVNVNQEIPAREITMARRRSMFVFFKQPVFASIALAILLAIGGGAYASEQSLPGSPLYPIKIHIIEKARSAVTVTPAARASWEVKRAERRLEELEQLSTQDALTIEIKNKLETEFERHMITATAISQKLRSRGSESKALEIQSTIEASLNAHSSVISRMNDHLNKIDDRIRDTQRRIEQQSKQTNQLRLEIEANVKNQVNKQLKTAAEGKRKTARNTIDQTKTMIEQRTAVDSELRAESMNKLNEAEHAFAEADAAFNAQAYAESFTKFQESIRKAQEARLFVSRLNKLELKLNRKNEKNKKKEDAEDNSAANTVEININGYVKRFDGLKNINLNIPIPNGSLIITREQNADKNNAGVSSDTTVNIHNGSITLNEETTATNGALSSQTQTTININASEETLRHATSDGE